MIVLSTPFRVGGNTSTSLSWHHRCVAITSSANQFAAIRLYSKNHKTSNRSIMTLDSFNKLPKEDARKALAASCGSCKWADLLKIHFPFSSEKELIDLATVIWYDECKEADWLEAFTHHPKIGDV